MGWTDSDTVKSHLLALDQNPNVYSDVEAAVDTDGKAVLPHRGLVEDSEKVKILKLLEPDSQSGVTMNGETWTQLSYGDLVPGEIVIADDDGLQTIYQMDADYCFNPQDGEIRRISGGSIGDGASVQTYYRRYQVMVETADYAINYSLGEIEIVVGGGLAENTTIWVDYQLSAASGVDNLIDGAITEAEDKILSRLKDDYSFDSEDQGLITGATELSLAILCRALSSRALVDGAPSAGDRAKGWRELADRYEAISWQTLRPFLAAPAMVSGSKRGNSSWGWD